jgi:hypothetical protein
VQILTLKFCGFVAHMSIGTAAIQGMADTDVILSLDEPLCSQLRLPGNASQTDGQAVVKTASSASRKGYANGCEGVDSRMPTHTPHAHAPAAYVACGNGCEGADSLPTHWCGECLKPVCWFCVTAHSRRSDLKSHALRKLSEIETSARLSR